MYDVPTSDQSHLTSVINFKPTDQCMTVLSVDQYDLASVVQLTNVFWHQSSKKNNPLYSKAYFEPTDQCMLCLHQTNAFRHQTSMKEYPICSSSYFKLADQCLTVLTSDQCRVASVINEK